MIWVIFVWSVCIIHMHTNVHTYTHFSQTNFSRGGVDFRIAHCNYFWKFEKADCEYGRNSFSTFGASSNVVKVFHVFSCMLCQIKFITWQFCVMASQTCCLTKWMSMTGTTRNVLLCGYWIKGLIRFPDKCTCSCICIHAVKFSMKLESQQVSVTMSHALFISKN